MAVPMLSSNDSSIVCDDPTFLPCICIAFMYLQVILCMLNIPLQRGVSEPSVEASLLVNWQA
jgi:hypothetical protein